MRGCGIAALIAAGCTALPPVTEHSPGPKIAEGRKLYRASCASCHRWNGEGREGVSLSLVNSKWVVGPGEKLVRIVLHGVRGPITAAGEEANLEMPAMGFFSDEEIAAVLTYIRSDWGNTAPAVTARTVARIREKTRDRTDSWTVAELDQVQ